MTLSSEGGITPRIIIHGGAGNIKRGNLDHEAEVTYSNAMRRILQSSNAFLSRPEATALDAATYAVSLLENDPLFNAGRGAVFTRAGTNELEASVMVSRGKRKRGVGVMLVRRVKNPILLAKEMLLRGEEDDGGGAGAHSQLCGETIEDLAREWGCEMVEPEYFYTQKRWDEHIRGLQREKERNSQSSVERCNGTDFNCNVLKPVGDPSWDGHEYLPQGTVGCVVLDRWGTLCAATSTGGLTNKLPGRIGDTPTLGAGFWAEEWTEEHRQVARSVTQPLYRPQARISPPLRELQNAPLSFLRYVIGDCIPGIGLSTYTRLVQNTDGQRSSENDYLTEKTRFFRVSGKPSRRAVAMSGTGNGDSFLRVAAVRTAAAICRFSGSGSSLATALAQVAGPGGELQQSAGDRWGVTGEGEGGIIGIELVSGKGKIAMDMNCGGMFRAWVDDEGVAQIRVFRDDA
ncbi:L-asparaginase precursor [Xylona heveae TC161]|uniref:L-asparaginase n=1 Tax=Xylona heveae (strain CBS 132557 / TC161) TaxID=1328760 RepID=A0A165FMC1_XYLHT|nr:L-asparaginase precursor [Xylona heveae TC161]KZF21151.1 L-asparaginase precursor [Xylona heveae TC161]